MLSDPHLKVVRYVTNSSEVFPSVDIKGGIAIIYRDAEHYFGEIGTFKVYNELESISSKVEHHADFEEGAFAELISSRGMYRFSDKLYEEHPTTKELQAKGTGNMITSNAFELYPDVFQ